ncbi:hypothetical protein BJV77DRAFT_770290 [Russula vinacea]|nr:hypothetical protein BJV77DRAFT_770290 [Russula vinacea]
MSLAEPFITTSWGLWRHLPNLTYVIPFLRYNMTSVRCGTNWPKKQRSTGILALLFGFSVRFAVITLLCTKAPMLPQLRSALPPPISTPFCGSHRRIHCATSPAIAQTRLLMFLFPLPVPFLFSLRPLIHPMRHLVTLPLEEDKSTKQTSSQNLLI